MRGLAAAILLSTASLGAAQTIVTSPKPDKVAVTVYRDPDGSGEMNLQWLDGFALVSETRMVNIPAGESELRFEGVAGGLLPQSAVVTGLGDSVREKNRDAKLLSPGTLLDASLGERVTLKRTSQATGKTVEQQAIVRAATNGVVIETEQGIETLRCDGESETLLARQLPAGLSAKPTLSTRIVAAQPYRGPVTLTYLSSNFDWRAHYVATLGPNGKTLSLFAWLTLANGDETSFADADTMAVAGRLNREDAERLRPETRGINLNCWPSQQTHQIPPNQVVLLARSPERYDLAVPAPPPPPPAAEAIVVTGARIVKAEREDLGDLKLYRMPIPVSVASRSQKQVAMIAQPKVRFTTEYQWTQPIDYEPDEPEPATQTLLFTNVEKEGLGLPLPAGTFSYFAVREGKPFLLGEGEMTDRAVNEKIEVPLTDTPGVRVFQRLVSNKDGLRETELVVTNDLPRSIPFSAWTLGPGYTLVGASAKLTKDRSDWRWRVTIPANASRTLRIRYRGND